MKKSRTFSGVAGSRRKSEEILSNSTKVVDHEVRRLNPWRGTKTKVVREEEIKARMEKGRAAAWAWYEHGKGSTGPGFNERVSSSSSSGTPIFDPGFDHAGASGTRTIRSSYDFGPSRFSRFKTEASMETSGRSMVSPRAELSHPQQSPSGHRRAVKSSLRPFSSEVLVTGSSSLFDSYELNSMSELIDNAVQRNGSSGSSSPTTSRLIVQDQGKGFSARRHSIGIFPPAAPYVGEEVAAVSDRNSKDLTSSGRNPEVRKASSLKLPFSRHGCASVSDVVEHKEMPGLGRSHMVRKDDHQTRDRSGWNPVRITRVHSVTRV
ncbi:unnamed protein product [Calypogeia fissa]